MKINSKSFGEIEIKEEEIITIVDGIFGYPRFLKYVILLSEQEKPFGWLQCIDDPNLAFVIIPPEVFYPDYKLDVSDDYLKKVGAEKPEDVIVNAIVVVPQNPQDMTANLLGPVIINPKNRLGCQTISNNPKHKLKHYILRDMKIKDSQQSTEENQ